MFYRIRLSKGVLYPRFLSYQLKQSEAVVGLWPRLILLLAASTIIFAMGAFFGIGTESISKEITTVSPYEFEMKKLLFTMGQALWGLIFAFLLIFLPALFFWTLTDIEYKKLLVIQSYAFLTILFGKVLTLLSSMILKIDPLSSPFSFGVMMQYITSSELVIAAFGSLTLFHLWMIFIQYYYLKELSEKSTGMILFLVLGMNVFFWIVSTLLTYIKIENLL
jgi:hypothetical protein